MHTYMIYTNIRYTLVFPHWCTFAFAKKFFHTFTFAKKFFCDNKTEDAVEDTQLQVGDMFKNHDEFVSKIKNYARKLGFVIRLEKVEYLNTSEKRNSKESSEEQEIITTEKIVQKRTLLCSR